MKASDIGIVAGGAAVSLMAGIATAHFGLAPMHRALDRAEAPAAAVTLGLPPPADDTSGWQAAVYRSDDKPAIVRIRASAPSPDLQSATAVSTDDSGPAIDGSAAADPGDGPSGEDADAARGGDGPLSMIVNPYAGSRNDPRSDAAAPIPDEAGAGGATPPAPQGDATHGH